MEITGLVFSGIAILLSIYSMSKHGAVSDELNALRTRIKTLESIIKSGRGVRTR